MQKVKIPSFPLQSMDRKGFLQRAVEHRFKLSSGEVPLFPLSIGERGEASLMLAFVTASQGIESIPLQSKHSFY